jgi:hypothetical protein
MDSPLLRVLSSLAWSLYRLLLIVGGLAWVCVATTFCGCSQANGWAMNKSGQRYYREGDYKAARFEFERALDEDPENASYAYNVAKAMQMQGDAAGAEQMYQRSIDIDPMHRPAYYGLSEVLAKQGRPQEARQIMQAARTRRPHSGEAQMSMANRRGPMGRSQFNGYGPMGQPAPAYGMGNGMSPYGPGMSSYDAGMSSGIVQGGYASQQTDGMSMYGMPMEGMPAEGMAMNGVPMSGMPMSDPMMTPIPTDPNMVSTMSTNGMSIQQTAMMPGGLPAPGPMTGSPYPMSSATPGMINSPLMSPPVELGQPMPITQASASFNGTTTSATPPAVQPF